MIENEKCAVGLKTGGRCVIPHVPDVTQSVQCDQLAVAFEKYGGLDHQVLPVCEKHRHLIRAIYEAYMGLRNEIDHIFSAVRP
jgi:hypothetical protein